MTARSRSATATPFDARALNGASPRAWEDWFPAASSKQQQEALELARQQGLLYLNQLAPVNGRAESLNGSVGNASLLSALAGDLNALPVVSPPGDAIDCPDLDAAQREAVRRALNTPDIFLLQGAPGTGKSRVVAETLRHACKRGWRVLFVAHYSASLDAALQFVASDPEVLALRNLAADELGSMLPPAIQSMTLARRSEAISQQMALTAANLRTSLNVQKETLARDTAAWTGLRSASTQLAQCELEIKEAEQALAAITDLAQGKIDDAHPLAKRIAECATSYNTQRSALNQQREAAATQLTTIESGLKELDKQVADLRPRAEARRNRRWWTWSWWKAGSEVVAQFERLEEEQKKRNEDATAARQSLESIDAQIKKLNDERAAARTSLIEEEASRQRIDTEQRLRTAAERRKYLAEALEQSIGTIDSESRPGDTSLAGVDAAYRVWESRSTAAQEKLALSEAWLSFLARSGPDLVRRLPELLNVVAAPVDALPPEQTNAAFDLLILEDAQHATEADVTRLARYAARMMLVANHESQVETGLPSAVNLRDTHSLRSSCFRKLWSALHSETISRPYQWRREEDRLCCQFRGISSSERGQLELEYLVDYPEVELRIACTPSPCLVEIAFPASMNLGQAKQFIYRELQEAACRHRAGTVWIEEDDDCVRCYLDAMQEADAQTAELEPGLMEVATEEHTHRFLFDKKAGWTRESAEGWLARNVGIRDGGRSLFLGTCHRASSSLGAILSDVLHAENIHAMPGPSSDQPGICFVPVPKNRLENGKKDERRPLTSPWPREGAGLEIDLAAIRPVDRIPNDLKAMLPRKGFANYFEAQAVVQYLESKASSGNTREEIAVIALYPGQVELIRLLMDRSSTLKGRPGITVGVPKDYRQREFSTVLISLTRSHSHRAVAIGIDPADLPLAFTRAVEQIVLFADPGNLIKRAAWNGPLEHLDAASAAHESKHIVPLVRYLQGQGACQQFWRVEM